MLPRIGISAKILFYFIVAYLLYLLMVYATIPPEDYCAQSTMKCVMDNIAPTIFDQSIFDNNSTWAFPRQKKNLPICATYPPDLNGQILVNMNPVDFDKIEDRYHNVLVGGKWSPPHCRARHRVAIVIPYRDRETHLKVLLNNLHGFLQKQEIDYAIILAEQAENQTMNKGKLMNVAFSEARKLYPWHCFIFHDVDLVPEDDRNLYWCPKQPRHMSVAIDKFNYKIPYNFLFGGVVAVMIKQFEQIHGFSNDFFGWGGENDSTFLRVKLAGYNISRYPGLVTRYKMIKHPADKRNSKNDCRFQLLREYRERWNTSGIYNLNNYQTAFLVREMPLTFDQPTCTPDHLEIEFIRRILRGTYSISQVTIANLTGYEDKNFRLTQIQYDRRDGPTTLILKVSNPVEAASEGHFEFQSLVYEILKKNGIPTPEIFPTRDGRDFSVEEVAPNEFLPVRLFHVIPGKILEEFDFTPEIIQKISSTLGKIHKIFDESLLTTIHIPYISARNIENLRPTAHLLTKENYISEDKLKMILEGFANYENLVKIGVTDEGIIHSDFNETNILIEEGEVSGVLDFGDAHRAPRAMDIGSLILYLHLSDRLEQGLGKLAKNVLEGYRLTREFHDSDDSILSCMRARISCSLIYGLRTARMRDQGSGSYVLKTQGPGWKCLEVIFVSPSDKRNLEFVVSAESL